MTSTSAYPPFSFPPPPSPDGSPARGAPKGREPYGALSNGDTKFCFSSFVYIIVYDLRYRRLQEGPLTTIGPIATIGPPAPRGFPSH